MQRIGVILVVASLLVLSVLHHPSFAMMHPAQGRFLQRDPVGYVDGMSGYEYVGSRPVIAVDSHGLKWFVENSKDYRRGTACTSDPNDTFEKLAEHPVIMLGSADYDKWLKEGWWGPPAALGTKPKLGVTYTWPNTFFVMVGDSWHIGLFGLFDDTNNQLVGARLMQSEAKSDKRFAVLDWHVTSGRLTNALTNRDTWGFAFFGHGNMSTLPPGGQSATHSPAVITTKRSGTHRLSYVILNMCQSANYKGVIENTERGRFKGFQDGSVSGSYPTPTGWGTPDWGEVHHSYEPVESLIKKAGGPYYPRPRETEPWEPLDPYPGYGHSQAFSF